MQLDEAVSQQLQRPTFPPFRCGTARLGNQARLSLFIKLRFSARTRAFFQRLQPHEREALARTLDGGSAGLDFFGDRQIVQAFIGFEQNPSARQLARRMFSTMEHLLQAGTLFISQGDVVLFRRHSWSFLLEESLSQRLHSSKSIHQDLCDETLDLSQVPRSQLSLMRKAE